CKYYTVDKGLAGGAPGAPATYVGMCHIFCDSIEAFRAGFGPHAAEIMADIPNYTDQTPVMQISEVVVDKQRLERSILNWETSRDPASARSSGRTSFLPPGQPARQVRSGASNRPATSQPHSRSFGSHPCRAPAHRVCD